MKVCVFNVPLNIKQDTKKDMLMKEGRAYIVPDAFPRMVRPDFIGLQKEYEPENLYKGEDLNGKSLICFRSGGIGDLMFISAALKKVKAKYPDAKLTLCCNENFIEMLKADEYNLVAMPLEEDYAEKHDYVLFFQGLIEENEEAEKINAYDLMAKHFGLEPDGKYEPVSTFPENHLTLIDAFLKAQVKEVEDPMFLALQLHASVPKRTIPMQLSVALAMTLPKNYVVLIVGSPGQSDVIDAYIERVPEQAQCKIVNFSRYYPKLEHAVALVSRVDIVVGPDSSLLHMAGAMDKPMVGIFGPFPSDLRLRYYKNAIGIDSNSKCEFAKGEYKSCFEHGDGSCRLAVKTFRYYSPCLEKIEVTHILDAMEQLGFNPRNKNTNDKVIEKKG